MKRKVFYILLCAIFIVSITGCGSKKENQKSNKLVDSKTGVIVITDDSNVNDKTTLTVKKDKSDYSDLSEKIEKYIAYDISLKNEKKVTLSKSAEVSIKIPEDYDKDNLIVYYIKDNKISETFDVEVSGDLAKFKTTHFSIYVLAQLKKEVQKVEEVQEDISDESKEEIKSESTNESSHQSKTESTTITNEEVTKPTEPAIPSCTAKKFNNKYTFVYSTRDECISRGNSDIYNLWDAGSQYDNVTTFGCEEIVDECGTTYYGEYFNIWVGPGVDDYQKLYY